MSFNAFRENSILAKISEYTVHQSQGFPRRVINLYYYQKVKHIFNTIPIFEVKKNNLSFGFYSTCTLVFWLPNLNKFD